LSKNSDGAYDNAELMNDKINTKYHEGLVSFTPDGKTMYFSRESYFEKDYQKDSLSRVRYSQLYLFKATKLGNDWDTVESLAINSENYSVKNPSVSADGNLHCTSLLICLEVMVILIYIKQQSMRMAP
jgi:hypothetical protein